MTRHRGSSRRCAAGGRWQAVADDEALGQLVAVVDAARVPHYGERGSYRNCHPNVGNADAAALGRCRTIERPWRGEVFGSALERYDTATLDTLARLTFDPQFDALFEAIDSFLSAPRSVSRPRSGW